MKKFLKILLIILALIIVFLIFVNIFVNLKGKAILTRKLEEIFKREVEIGKLKASFPANIYIDDLKIKGLIKVDKVFAGGGAFDIFRNTLKLSLLKLTRPEFNLERNPSRSSAKLGALSDKKPEKKHSEIFAAGFSPMSSNIDFLFPSLSLGRLIIDDGTLNFTDKTLESPITIRVRKLNLKISNLYFTSRGSQVTSFEIEGSIPWQEGQEEGNVEAEGWIDLFKKNMEAVLKIEDIDGIYLYPYYSSWVDLEKARIEKAKLNFSSNIHGLNNDITAHCHLELTDIVRTPRSGDESEDKAEKIANAVLDIFRALNQGKIILDFTIRTKMDRPKFGFSEIKTAVESRLAQAKKPNGFNADVVVALPGKIVEGTFKGLTDVAKALIVGTVSAGKELGKTIEGSFKKEKKEEE